MKGMTGHDVNLNSKWRHLCFQQPALAEIAPLIRDVSSLHTMTPTVQ